MYNNIMQCDRLGDGQKAKSHKFTTGAAISGGRCAPGFLDSFGGGKQHAIDKRGDGEHSTNDGAGSKNHRVSRSRRKVTLAWYLRCQEVSKALLCLCVDNLDGGDFVIEECT